MPGERIFDDSRKLVERLAEISKDVGEAPQLDREVIRRFGDPDSIIKIKRNYYVLIGGSLYRL